MNEDRRPQVFEPNNRALFRAMRPNISDAMLRKIAEADYGQGADETEFTLRKMRDDPDHTGASDFQTSEVLELMRWSEPDDPEWEPSGRGVTGHWMRAFCSAWLLREIGEYGGYVGNNAYSDTIIQLVQSVDYLPADFWSQTGALLEWAADESVSRDGPIDEIIFAIAIFWCAFRSTMNSPCISDLGRWIVDPQRISADRFDSTLHWPFQLIGGSSLLDRHWRRVGTQMECAGHEHPDRKVAEWASLIGSKMKAA